MTYQIKRMRKAYPGDECSDIREEYEISFFGLRESSQDLDEAM